MRVVLRGVGWLFILAGTVVALYIVYNLYWTGRETARAQAELLEAWEDEFGGILDAAEAAPAAPGGDGDGADEEAVAPLPTETRPELAPVDVGEAVAAIQFVRPGQEQAPLINEPILIVEGVTVAALRTGPGHYPGSALPGEHGNFAVAGHRTTYGAPFFDLDRAAPGDQVHVTDRNGDRWIYEVVDQEVVSPWDVHVLTRDPLDLGRPMLTLTTCEPRFSNRQRLITYATLIDEQIPLARGMPGQAVAPQEIVGEDV